MLSDQEPVREIDDGAGEAVLNVGRRPWVRPSVRRCVRRADLLRVRQAPAPVTSISLCTPAECTVHTAAFGDSVGQAAVVDRHVVGTTITGRMNPNTTDKRPVAHLCTKNSNEGRHNRGNIFQEELGFC